MFLVFLIVTQQVLKSLFLTGFCGAVCDDRESLLQYLNIIQGDENHEMRMMMLYAQLLKIVSWDRVADSGAISTFLVITQA